jgi:hypothetical protein
MKVNGEKIRTLLAWGMTVHSRALGRVGPVTRVDGEYIYIRLRNGQEGVTSFKWGDPVRFVFHKDDHVDIVNDEEFF